MADPAPPPPVAPGSRRELAARSLLWWLLAAWAGSWLCFALVVAPLAFRVLPSAEVAGQLVGPVLARLHWGGAVAGVALSLLAARLRRGRLLVALPLVLAVACLASELGVTPQMADLRDAAFGPDGDLTALLRYRRLHGLSMGIFSAVLLGTLALVPLHVRRESPQAADSPR